MTLTDDMKNEIFQESFFGALNCRFNQGQLESKGILIAYLTVLGLDEYNDLVYYQLLDQLMGKNDVILDEPDNPLNPCWTDIFESQAAFDSAVGHLADWYDKMTNKIKSLRRKETETRVRLTGNMFYMIYFICHI